VGDVEQVAHLAHKMVLVRADFFVGIVNLPHVFNDAGDVASPIPASR
jgi:hypothetical protein